MPHTSPPVPFAEIPRAPLLGTLAEVTSSKSNSGSSSDGYTTIPTPLPPPTPHKWKIPCPSPQRTSSSEGYRVAQSAVLFGCWRLIEVRRRYLHTWAALMLIIVSSIHSEFLSNYWPTLYCYHPCFPRALREGLGQIRCFPRDVMMICPRPAIIRRRCPRAGCGVLSLSNGNKCPSTYWNEWPPAG